VLARLTAPGRDTVTRATAALMADGFGLSSYRAVELDQLFTLLRELRLAAGDFAEGEPASG
jgi:hypothetical protein